MRLTTFSKLLILFVLLSGVFIAVNKTDLPQFLLTEKTLIKKCEDNNFTYIKYLHMGSYIDCIEGYTPHWIKVKDQQGKEKKICFCNSTFFSYLKD